MQAAVKGNLVALNIFSAYDYGVDLEDIVTGTGASATVDLEILVEDLNGSGATVDSVTVDSNGFMTLTDEDAISDNRERFIESIELLKDGLEELPAAEQDKTEDIKVLGKRLGNYGEYDDFIDFLDEIIESAEDEGLVEISIITGRTVSVDIYEFFENPPSFEDVSSTDPFIYNSDDDRVEAVESFFSDMFEDIIDY